MRGCITGRRLKDGSTTWQLKYYTGSEGNRKVHYKNIRDVSKKEAEKKLREILTHVDKGTHVDPSRVHFSEWVNEWKKVIEPEVSAKTFERYSEFCKHQILPQLGHLRLQSIGPSDIKKFVSWLRTDGRVLETSSGKGLAPKTVLHVFRTLSQILKAAVDEEKISRNPCDKVPAPSPKKVTTSYSSETGSTEAMQAIDQAQLEVLLQALRDNRFFEAFAIATATGMRRGEILGLRWCDVDTDKRTIGVWQVVEETNTHGVRIKSFPKTDSSRRIIGIDEGLVSILQKLWKRQAEESLRWGVAIEKGSLLFPKSPLELDKPVCPRSVSKAFKRAAEKAGFPTLRLHDLRHTHATILLTEGIPVNTVSRRLGHANATMTLNIYGHVLKRSEEAAVAVSAVMLKSLTIE